MLYIFLLLRSRGAYQCILFFRKVQGLFTVSSRECENDFAV